MGKEIERKFLVTGSDWKKDAWAVKCRQGYVCLNEEATVRVRIKGDRGYLTIKGKSVGISRNEYEYEIPVQDAVEMLEDLCEKPLIEKLRYTIRYKGFVWEVDEFAGENAGLVIAEIELADEAEEFIRPDWVGQEVSGDHRYYNVSLSLHPWSSWSKTAE